MVLVFQAQCRIYGRIEHLPNDGCQITFHKLFVEVDLVVCAWVAHNVHVVQACNVPVTYVTQSDRVQKQRPSTVTNNTSEMIQQFNLSHGALCKDALAEDICDFLDGDRLGRSGL